MTDLREKALRLASTLPKGSDTRRSLLTILNREAGKQAGQAILNKMGGTLHLETMLGLTDFAFHPNGVEFGWPNRDRKRGNFVRFAHLGNDLYSVDFEAISTRGRKPVVSYWKIKADELVDLFEKQTGWLLHLGKTSNLHREMEETYGPRKIQPKAKDRKRIWDMMDKANGDDRKILALASRMARAITKADKAYRRYLAAESENFHDVAAIFWDRARDLI